MDLDFSGIILELQGCMECISRKNDHGEPSWWPSPIIIRWLKTYQIPRPPDTRASKVNDRAEQLSRWYEEKREDILFGRYQRWHNNALWKKMREEWAKDPGLKDDMFDYFEIEERKGGKVKKWHSSFSNITFHTRQQLFQTDAGDSYLPCAFGQR